MSKPKEGKKNIKDERQEVRKESLSPKDRGLEPTRLFLWPNLIQTLGSVSAHTDRREANEEKC
jgi:hypothetical protein